MKKKNDAVQAVSCSITVNVTFLDPVILPLAIYFSFLPTIQQWYCAILITHAGVLAWWLTIIS